MLLGSIDGPGQGWVVFVFQEPPWTWEFKLSILGAAKESVAASPKAPSPPDPEPTQKTAPTDSTSVRVVSAGHGDGNIADFFLNDKKIDIRGEAGRRGINMVVLDPETQ